VQLPDSQSFASFFFDYDNDGFPDLLVNSFFFSADESLRSYLGLPHSATTLKLFKNMKDGTFKDVTTDVGLDKVYAPMGANFGDVDNDGFLDIYLGTGGPEYGFLLPKVLLRNDRGKSFVDISVSAGIGDLHKGHGTAFADLRNGGQEDRDKNHGRQQGPGYPLDLSYGRQRWILWRLAISSAHWPREIGTYAQCGNIMASKQHLAEVFEYQAQPVHSDQRVCQGIQNAHAQTFPIRKQKRRRHGHSTSRQWREKIMSI
jgi:hypothetical protein